MGRLRQEISEGEAERNKLVAERRWRDKSTANQEQARIVGVVARPGPGHEHGLDDPEQGTNLNKL